MKEIVLYLRAMNEQMESLEVRLRMENLVNRRYTFTQVKHLLDKYELKT